jgi:hypothetical protein
MAELEKVIKGLECCILRDPDDKQRCSECPYEGNCVNRLKMDALSMLKAQGEVIDALLKVGYPHNFQMEEPWIVNYMYAITDVMKKAVNLRNG